MNPIDPITGIALYSRHQRLYQPLQKAMIKIGNFEEILKYALGVENPIAHNPKRAFKALTYFPHTSTNPITRAQEQMRKLEGLRCYANI
jgi:hypothetical protein